LHHLVSRWAPWWPPYQVILAAFGFAIALIPRLPHVQLRSDLILGVFVPALVFEAALNLNLDALRRVAIQVAVLATFGVVLSIALVGLLVHLALGLAWSDSFLLGALLSPTDPIAVVAVVRRSAAPARLGALLEGESLFNDGTGVAAFTAILAAIAAGHLSPSRIGMSFLALTVAGLAIGAVIGLAGATIVRSTTNTVIEVLATVVVAYGSYWVAALLGASGVIAVVVAGVAMARVGTWGKHTERSWARLAIVLNTVLFILIGLGLPAAQVLALWVTVLVGYGILLGARLVPVYLLSFGIPHRWRQLLWWGGVRGALSVVLALVAAAEPRVGRSVPVVAYGIVALSLLLQGTLVRPVARWAKLA
jgi:CPA1 family monovalent cation:H+ antiporter